MLSRALVVLLVMLAGAAASAQTAPQTRADCIALGFTSIIEGTAGDDNLVGTAGPDCILGYGGNDRINGGGGDDVIAGGPGNDTIDGGLGNDILYGEDGDDFIQGGDGDDVIYGGPGNDDLRGGNGDDDIVGGEGDDTIRGGDGNDRLSGGPGTDWIQGGAGNDDCTGGELGPGCETMTPTSLATFLARAHPHGVELRWRTRAEAGVVAYVIARESGETVGSVLADGLRGALYRLEDPLGVNGERYVLYEMDASGAERFVAETVAGDDVVADAQAAPIAAARGKPNGEGAHRGRPHVAARVHAPGEGVLAVSVSELAEALNVPRARVLAAMRSSHLSVTRGGEAVAWIDRGDEVWVVAAPEPTGFAAGGTFVFALAPGARAATLPRAKRLRDVSAVDVTDRFEQDIFAGLVAARDPSGDPWFWKGFGASIKGAKRATFAVAAPDAVAGGRLHLQLHGATETTHSIQVWWNGALAATIGGADREPFEADVAVSGVASTNTLELVAVGSPDSIWYLDAIELSYRRAPRARAGQLRYFARQGDAISPTGFTAPPVVLDVTHPRQPRVVSGFIAPLDGELLALEPERVMRATPAPIYASDVLQDDGADLLIVHPRGFEAGAARLAALREGEGWKARVVDTQTLYDVMSHSAPDPLAAKRLLAHGHAHWATKPRVLVLLGSGTFDYQDRWGVGDNLVPPAMVDTPYGLYSADATLGDVDEAPGLEVAVGRLPARDLAELMAVLDAIESAPLLGQSELFIADADDGRVTFGADLASLGGVVVQDRAAVLSAWGESDLVVYAGHGGLDRWSDRSLLITADAETLVGTPVVLAMTCSSARFEIPGAPSIGQSLVMKGGATAYLGASGLSEHRGSMLFLSELKSSLDNPAHETLADAWIAASAGTLPTYQWFGDPAMRLR